MGWDILAPLKRGHGSTMRDNTVVVLTPLGRTKAEQYTAQGSMFDVLEILKRGPCSITEISNETKLPINKARAIVSEIISSGYARRAMGEETH
jgi:hypothetical protein